VIVCDDQRGRIAPDGIGEQFGNSDYGCMDRSLIDGLDVEHPVFCVERDHAHLLTLERSHIVKMCDEIGG